MTAGERVFVVPGTPGSLREVPGNRTPDEVDELLDDLFGPADDGGPGIADAVLATGGGAAVLAGLWWSAPVIVALGLVAVLLGSILPARSLWRRAREQRLAARRRDALGAGTPLRVAPGPVADLVAAHEELFVLAEAQPTAVGAEERAAAHAAVSDVASVLAGGAPATRDEVAFVADRASSLIDLVAGIRDEMARRAEPTSDADVRRARLDARHEVDRIAGTSSADELRRLADRRRRSSDG